MEAGKLAEMVQKFLAIPGSVEKGGPRKSSLEWRSKGDMGIRYGQGKKNDFGGRLKGNNFLTRGGERRWNPQNRMGHRKKSRYVSGASGREGLTRRTKSRQGTDRMQHLTNEKAKRVGTDSRGGQTRSFRLLEKKGMGTGGEFKKKKSARKRIKRGGCSSGELERRRRSRSRHKDKRTRREKIQSKSGGRESKKKKRRETFPGSQQADD